MAVEQRIEVKVEGDLGDVTNFADRVAAIQLDLAGREVRALRLTSENDRRLIERERAETRALRASHEGLSRQADGLRWELARLRERVEKLGDDLDARDETIASLVVKLGDERRVNAEHAELNGELRDQIKRRDKGTDLDYAAIERLSIQLAEAEDERDDFKRRRDIVSKRAKQWAKAADHEANRVERLSERLRAVHADRAIWRDRALGGSVLGKVIVGRYYTEDGYFDSKPDPCAMVISPQTA